MADYQQGYAYCSPFLPVASLDAHLALPDSPVYNLVDSDYDPEMALHRAQDYRTLTNWVNALPPTLRRTVTALLRDESQATIARREGVSEAAISKRLAKLRELGRCDLASLRQSPLLH